MPDNGVDWLRRTECPLCGGSSLKKRESAVPDFTSNIGLFDILVCAGCGLGMTDPYPSEQTVSLLYSHRDTRDFDGNNSGFFNWIKDTLARRELRALGSAEGSGINLLDVGTGNGRFAIAAARERPANHVTAVDFQEEPPPQISSAGLANLEYVPFAKIGGLERRFDLIFLRHVLEHVHDPRGFLVRLRDLLAPEGTLAIEVPNLNSGTGRLLGRYWDMYYVPRHLFHYTSSSLARILAEAGLSGPIGKAEMPKMGTTLANVLGSKAYTNRHRFAGLLLHPFQLLAEGLTRSSSCLGVRARRAG